MICADWHPDDERLLARYLDRADDPTLDSHLAWCRPCTRRLSAMSQDLEGWHRTVSDEADEAFDEARLMAQRRGVQQRLGAAVPARVLPFPVAATERHPPLARVAAAVLLLALTGAGAFRVLQMPEPPPSPAAYRPSPVRSAQQARVVREATADAAALEDIDLALMRPRTAELRALDEFTPNVRDIVAARR